MPQRRSSTSARAAAGKPGAKRSAARGVAIDLPPAHLDPYLDAAAAVVLRDGMGRLTLDAVAREVGISKTGLLHHFPSKDALIRTIVARDVARWHSEFRSAFARLEHEGEARPAVESLMSMCLAGTHAWTDAERARNRVLVAALVHDEAMVEPMRSVGRGIGELLKKDAASPAAADVLHLAIHGLWFEWIFGMGEVSSSRLKAIRAVLRAIADLDPQAAPASARRREGLSTKASKQPSKQASRQATKKASSKASPRARTRRAPGGSGGRAASRAQSTPRSRGTT